MKENYSTIVHSIKNGDILNENCINSLENTATLNLETIIKEKNYSAILQYCSLKNIIFKELANKELDNDYANRVVRVIQNNKVLKDSIRKKYFSNIPYILSSSEENIM